MKHIHPHTGIRFFMALLIIQLLNLSICSVNFYRVDRTRGTFEETDYVDSMIEYVVENVMHFSKHTFHAKSAMANNARQQATGHIVLKWMPFTQQLFTAQEFSPQNEPLFTRTEALITFFQYEAPAQPPRLSA